MTRRLVAGLFFGSILAGCGSPQKTTLDEIRHVETYNASKSAIIEIVRMYSTLEEFRLERCDPATGKVVGVRRVFYERPEESKTVVMNLSITPLDSVRTEVHSQFAFTGVRSAISEQDQSALVECYQKLFDLLDTRFAK